MQPLQLGLMINDSHRSSEVVAHIDVVSLINSMIGAIVPGVSSQVFVGGISFLVMISESGLRTDASFLAFALVTGASLLLNPALQHRPLPLLLSAICTGSPVSPTQGLAQHDYQGSCSQPGQGHRSTPEAFTNRHDRRRWTGTDKVKPEDWGVHERSASCNAATPNGQCSSPWRLQNRRTREHC